VRAIIVMVLQALPREGTPRTLRRPIAMKNDWDHAASYRLSRLTMSRSRLAGRKKLIAMSHDAGEPGETLRLDPTLR
jgi:hypothetical protein